MLNDIVLVGVRGSGDPIEVVSMDEVVVPCPICGATFDKVAATHRAGEAFARYAFSRLAGVFMDGFFAEYRKQYPQRLN